eukprot:7300790-Prymnesium_polylepis.1
MQAEGDGWAHEAAASAGGEQILRTPWRGCKKPRVQSTADFRGAPDGGAGLEPAAVRTGAPIWIHCCRSYRRLELVPFVKLDAAPLGHATHHLARALARERRVRVQHHQIVRPLAALALQLHVGLRPHLGVDPAHLKPPQQTRGDERALRTHKGAASAGGRRVPTSDIGASPPPPRVSPPRRKRRRTAAAGARVG